MKTFLNQMEKDFPDKAGVYIDFSESLAHQIYAGADMF
ncbi:glycogen synthase [Neobacillus cucumis]|nr:glycogen synthase [Neobacillus cucumis]